MQNGTNLHDRAPGKKEQAQWNFETDLMVVAPGAGGLAAAFKASLEGTLGAVNRPGFELTPRSWTVTMAPVRRCFSAGIALG